METENATVGSPPPTPPPTGSTPWPSVRLDPPAARSLIIVVPAYNEAKRIAPTLHRYAAHFRQHYRGEFHLLVVLNGCRDNTRQVVADVGTELPEVQWVEFGPAIGKGGALIEGLRYANRAELIGFTDADGSTSPESFLRLVQACEECDAAVGSRRMPGSVIHQSQPSHRMVASAVFHGIVELFFRLGIQDTQCGAKVLRRAAALQIHHTLQIADMAFDVNLLYSLKRARLRVREVPVEWTDSAGSTVRYFRTSLVMFFSIVRLRLVYSPFYRWLRPLRPLEAWIYTSLLHNPPPRPLGSPDPGATLDPEASNGANAP